MKKIYISFILILVVCICNFFSQNYKSIENTKSDSNKNCSLTFSIIYPNSDCLEDMGNIFKKNFSEIMNNRWNFLFNGLNSDGWCWLENWFFYSNPEAYTVSFFYNWKGGFGGISVHKTNLSQGSEIIIYQSENNINRSYNSLYQEYQQICDEYFSKY